MFGISLTEIAVVALIALVVVGPKNLPKMLRTVGEYIGRLRRLTTDVRAQTGIDDILREEGIEGGLSELRSIMRGDLSSIDQNMGSDYDSEGIDTSIEYPDEGVDAYGVLPDDLFPSESLDESPGDTEEDAQPSTSPSSESVA